LIAMTDTIEECIWLEDIFLLTDSNRSKRGDNIFCYQKDGTLKWQIESSRPIDFYNYYLSLYCDWGNFK
jgi:hypothetical protein